MGQFYNEIRRWGKAKVKSKKAKGSGFRGISTFREFSKHRNESLGGLKGGFRSRLERDDLAVLPDVDGRPVGTRSLSGGFRGAAQGATYGQRKLL